MWIFAGVLAVIEQDDLDKREDFRTFYLFYQRDDHFLLIL